MTCLARFFVAVLFLVGIGGCRALTVTPPIPTRIEVQGHLQFASYHALALVSPYTITDIDHVRLHLLLQDSQGVYQDTGVSSSVITKGALTLPVHLSNLKQASAYRIQADAYADAAESLLISNRALSQTDFNTPAVTTQAGVQSIDTTPLSLLPIKCQLSDKTYAGHANVSVNVASNVGAGRGQNRLTTLRVTLSYSSQPGQPIGTKTLSYTGSDPQLILTNLRFGTSYHFVTQGFDATGNQLSKDSNSTLDFSTPALSASLNDDLGTLTLPCSK